MYSNCDFRWGRQTQLRTTSCSSRPMRRSSMPQHSGQWTHRLCLELTSPALSRMEHHATRARFTPGVPRHALRLTEDRHMYEARPVGAGLSTPSASTSRRTSLQTQNCPAIRRGSFDLLFFSGAKGSRTPDLVDANDALYQLSYSPIAGIVYACFPTPLPFMKFNV